ncbi:MAG: hypothetical protein KKB31_02995 [Nanoarchaeota archaeon]|nr:hypothetical protein [Nanoarchaeota archaeon]
MDKKIIPILIFVFIYSLNFASALVVDADYITLYPGEQGKITINVDNNEDFDIEKISVNLDLSDLPFTSVGSSQEDIDDIREGRDEDASFTLRASNEIVPGDYEIPYEITYFEDGVESNLKKEGSFGLRVSSRTELDFTFDLKGKDIDSAIVGQEGKISLEIINKGLGGIRAVQIEIFPEGFELLSKDKVFVGNIDGDDTDLANFDVIFNSSEGVMKAKITYKDFDNKEQIENINLPFTVYTEKEALEKGLIIKSNTGKYITIIIVLLIIWIAFRRWRKSRRRNNKGR